MNPPSDQRLYLATIATATLMVAIIIGIVRPRADETTPRQLPALAGWLASHPADFAAAAAISEQALDSPARDRFALWREAHAHAAAMAPQREQARNAFARSGLFHWYELAPRDRREVLRNTQPLLRQPGQFRVLAQPLFQLTHDFELLRRNRPDDLEAIGILASIASTNGLFAQYRTVRNDDVAERMRTFQSIRTFATPNELLAIVPPLFDHDYEPLVRGVLDELRRRPLDGQPENPATIDHIVEYAMRHGVGTLTGIDAVIAMPGAASDVTRARLALHNGEVEHSGSIQLASSVTDPAAWADYYDERAAAATKAGEPALASTYASRAWLGHSDRQRWRGLCGEMLCSRAVAEALATDARPLTLTLRAGEPATDLPPAYVEIYVDDVRVAEGEVGSAATFSAATISAGSHPVAIRLVNPFTPQARQRRLIPPPAPL